MSLEFLYQNTALPGTAFPLVGLTLSKNATYRHECQFTLDSRDNTWTPEVGHIIDVLEHIGAPSPIRLFAGPIKAVNTTVIETTTPKIRRHVVTCADYTDLTHRVLGGERAFAQRKLNDIILVLFDAGAGYGINTTSITPGGGPTIEKFDIDFASLAECMNQLMQMAGGGIWWIDEDVELRYQLGVPGSPTFAIDNSCDWVELHTLALEKSLENYANKLVVSTSKYELPEVTESFGGAHPTQPTDGARKVWIVNTSVARTPTVAVNGSSQTVGILGVDTGKQWYWSQGSREIEQDDAGTALPNTSTIAITYAGIAVGREYVENSGEMTARGIFERRIDINRLTTQADLEQTAAALIAEYSQPSFILRFAVKKFGTQRPKPGDRVDISRTGYETVTGLIVDQVQYVPLPVGPTELQRIIVAKKGPRIGDGRDLIASGSVSGSVSGSISSGGGGGTAFAWAPDVSIGSGSTAPNHALYTHFRFTATGNFTLANMTGIRDAVPFVIIIRYDGVGGHVVTFGSDYTDMDPVPQANSQYVIQGIGRGTGVEILSAENQL